MPLPKDPYDPNTLDLHQEVIDAANEYGVDPSLALAVAHHESGFNPKAKSPKGARGVFQLMPQTAKDLGVQNIDDPRENIRGGTRYLRSLLDKYRDTEDPVTRALAGYNAGPHRVDQYNGVPPFAETQNYVRNVKATREKLFDKFGGAFQGRENTPSNQGGQSSQPQIVDLLKEGNGSNIVDLLNPPSQPNQFPDLANGPTPEMPQESSPTAKRPLTVSAPRRAQAQPPTQPQQQDNTFRLNVGRSRRMTPGEVDFSNAFEQLKASGNVEEASKKAEAMKKSFGWNVTYDVDPQTGIRWPSISPPKGVGQPMREPEAKKFSQGTEKFVNNYFNQQTPGKVPPPTNPIARVASEIGGGQLMGGVGNVISGTGRVLGDVLNNFRDRPQGFNGPPSNPLVGFGQQMSDVGQFAEEGASKNPVAKFGRSLVGTLPYLGLPGGVGSLATTMYLQGRGQGLSHDEALKHTVASVGGLVGGSALGHSLQQGIENEIARYLTRAGSIGTGIEAGSVINKEPQTPEDIAQRYGMGAAFGLQGVRFKPKSVVEAEGPPQLPGMVDYGKVQSERISPEAVTEPSRLLGPGQVEAQTPKSPISPEGNTPPSGEAIRPHQQKAEVDRIQNEYRKNIETLKSQVGENLSYADYLDKVQEAQNTRDSALADVQKRTTETVAQRAQRPIETPRPVATAERPVEEAQFVEKPQESLQTTRPQEQTNLPFRRAELEAARQSEGRQRVKLDADEVAAEVGGPFIKQKNDDGSITYAPDPDKHWYGNASGTQHPNGRYYLNPSAAQLIANAHDSLSLVGGVQLTPEVRRQTLRHIDRELDLSDANAHSGNSDPLQEPEVRDGVEKFYNWLQDLDEKHRGETVPVSTFGLPKGLEELRGTVRHEQTHVDLQNVEDELQSQYGMGTRAVPAQHFAQAARRSKRGASDLSMLLDHLAYGSNGTREKPTGGYGHETIYDADGNPTDYAVNEINSFLNSGSKQIRELGFDTNTKEGQNRAYYIAKALHRAVESGHRDKPPEIRRKIHEALAKSARPGISRNLRQGAIENVTKQRRKAVSPTKGNDRGISGGRRQEGLPSNAQTLRSPRGSVGAEVGGVSGRVQGGRGRGQLGLPYPPGPDIQPAVMAEARGRASAKAKPQLKATETTTLPAPGPLKPNSYHSAVVKKGVEEAKKGGGYTFTPDLQRTYEGDKGFVVTLTSEYVPAKDLKGSDVVQFRNKWLGVLRNHPDTTIGVFHMGEDEGPHKGEVSLDLNTIVPDKAKAVKLGSPQFFNQKAIWDLEKSDVVETGGDGTPRITTAPEIEKALENLHKPNFKLVSPDVEAKKLDDYLTSNYGTTTPSKVGGAHFLLGDGTLTGDILEHNVAATGALKSAGITIGRKSDPSVEMVKRNGAIRILAHGDELNITVGNKITKPQLETIGRLVAEDRERAFYYDIYDPETRKALSYWTMPFDGWSRFRREPIVRKVTEGPQFRLATPTVSPKKLDDYLIKQYGEDKPEGLGGGHWILADGRITGSVDHPNSARMALKSQGYSTRIPDPRPELVRHNGAVRLLLNRTSVNVEVGGKITIPQVQAIAKIVADNPQRNFNYDIYEPETREVLSFFNVFDQGSRGMDGWSMFRREPLVQEADWPQFKITKNTELSEPRDFKRYIPPDPFYFWEEKPKGTFTVYRRKGRNPNHNIEPVATVKDEAEAIATTRRLKIRAGQDNPSVVKVDPFYSGMAKVLEQKMPNKASVDQVRGILNSPGIKKDEVQWSGIDNFLRGKKTVTREEVAQFLSENSPSLIETVFGPALTPEGRRHQDKVKKLHVTFTQAKLKSQASIDAAVKAIDEGLQRIELPDLDEPSPEPKLYAKADKAGFFTRGKSYIRTLFRVGNEDYLDLFKEIAGKKSEAIDKAVEDYKAYKTAQEEYYDNMDRPNTDQETQYGWVTEPLGKGNNYREVVLRWGDGDSRYLSPHWGKYGPQVGEVDLEEDNPPLTNPVVHFRGDDRTDSDGDYVFLVHEIQDELHNEVAALKGQIKKNEAENKSAAGLREKLQELEGALPFRGKSHELALKRILRFAVENGYDGIVWTTGEQQRDRNSLTKYLDTLGYFKWEKDGKPFYNLQGGKDGNKVLQKTGIPESELPGIVGAQLAQRIIKGEKSSEIEEKGFMADEPKTKWSVFTGLDLKIGGEGKDQYYDVMIPKFLREYTKQWGATVTSTTVPTAGRIIKVRNRRSDDVVGSFSVDSNDDRHPEDIIKEQGYDPTTYYGKDLPRTTHTVHKLKFTPPMESVVTSGQTQWKIVDPRLVGTFNGTFKPENKLTNKTNPKNAQKNITNLDIIFKRNPTPLKSPKHWQKFMAEVYGDKEGLVPPYKALEYYQDPEKIVTMLGRLTPAQIESVNRGLDHAQGTRQRYTSGEATVEDTALFFLWSILSRKVSPGSQESTLLDAVDGGVMEFIAPAARDGKFDNNDLRRFVEWSHEAVPTDSPGNMAAFNLRSYGEDFLTKMVEKVTEGPGKGQTKLQRMHNLIAGGASSAEIRREFFLHAESVGLDSKILSFMLLVTGRTDALVLDRVQTRHLWDASGHRKQYGVDNIYDGYGVTSDTTGKKQPVGIGNEFSGVKGLAFYEALETGLQGPLEEAYKQLGREQGSFGRFHWESWLVEGSQEADHSTLGVIESRNTEGVRAKEGRFGLYTYGMRYGVHQGKRDFVLDTSDGTSYLFTPQDRVKYVNILREHSSKTNLPPGEERIIPNGFSVRQAGKDQPWVQDPRVNREALDNLIQRLGSRLPQGDTQTAVADGTRQTGHGDEQPKIVHKQFGTVTKAEDQKGIAKGHVRVVDEAGTSHVIKTVGKNQYAVTIPEKPQFKISPDTLPQPWKERYSSFTEEVPIEFLHKIREYDRTDRKKIDKLKESILKEGLQEPLIIAVGKDTGTAQLSEGNNRLQALKELGFTKVPARVMVQNNTYRHDEVMSREPVKIPMVPKKGEYFTSDAKPSKVFPELQSQEKPKPQFRVAPNNIPTQMTKKELAVSLYKTGLLSSPHTSIINITSNAIFQGAEEISRGPAVILDWLMAKKSGVRAVAPPTASHVFNIQAWREASEAFKSTMKHGATAQQIIAGNLPRNVTTGRPLLDAFIRFSGRMYGAQDAWFKSFAYRRALDEMAHVLTLKELRNGTIQRGDFSRRKDEIVRGIGITPVQRDEMDAYGIQVAAFVTFQDKNLLVKEVDTAVGKLADKWGQWLQTGYEFSAPFRNTPANIVLRSLDYTPVAPFLRTLGVVADYNKTKQWTPELQRRVAMAWGRGSVGLGIILLGFAAAAGGVAVGLFGRDHKKRRAYESAGIVEGSVKVGNKWIQISSLGPVGTLFGLGATLHDLWEEDKDTLAKKSAEKQSMASRVGRVTTKALGDSILGQHPLLSPTRDLVEAPEKDLTTTVGNFSKNKAASFVPAAVRDVAKLTDSKEREATTVEQAVKKNIPGLRQTLPVKKDVVGRDVEKSLGERVSGLFIRTGFGEKDTGALSELRRLNVDPGYAQPKPGESKEQTKQRTAEKDTTRGPVLEALVKSDQYKDLSDSQKKLALTKALSSDKTKQVLGNEKLTNYLVDKIIESSKKTDYNQRSVEKTKENPAFQKLPEERQRSLVNRLKSR